MGSLRRSLVSPLAENWPQWRGPDLNGVSHEKNLPVKWSRDENVAWKLALPSRSGATPVIWGDRIFLNVADKDDIFLWCVDRTRGAVIWKKFLTSGNYKINKQNMSSPSPVTDGTHVYIMTGNGILKAFDFDGKRGLGARHSERLRQVWIELGLRVVAAAVRRRALRGSAARDEDARIPRTCCASIRRPAKTVWRVERPTEAVRESPDAYTTPALVRYDGTTEIVVSGGDCVTGHDPATGKELWRGNGFNPQKDGAYRVIASPVVFDDVVYTPTRVRPLQAFRAGGRGDITETRRLWAFPNGPDVPTPVTDGTLFYVVNDRGIVWCLDAKTGKEIWGPQRIQHGIYSASPVLADGKIYITSEDGITTVFRAGPQFELLAENNLDEYTLSSIAISGGQLFLRTEQFLYCIGKPAGR